MRNDNSIRGLSLIVLRMILKVIFPRGSKSSVRLMGILLASLQCLDSYAESVLKESSTAHHLELANSGNAKSAYWLARHYEKINDTIESKQWLLRAAKLGSKAAIAELGYNSPYVAETTGICGSFTIVVKTHCVGIDKVDAMPICQSQNISFVRKGHDRKFVLLNRQRKDKYSLARYVRCLGSPDSSWLAIESNNLGSGNSCSDCERIDVFDTDAAYVGSVGSLSDLEVFDPQTSTKLNRDISKEILDSARTISGFEINSFPAIK